MQVSDYSRQLNESSDDYMVRLFSLQHDKVLNCNEVCDLLNKDRGVQYGESAYRKYYRAFEDGMRYRDRQINSNVGKKILCISDLHYPYQLNKETFANYINEVDILVLNGDLIDMKEISSFERSYRQSPMDEIIGCRSYLIDLIKYINPKTVYANYGNHDMRFHKYLAKNLDTDLLELMPDTALDIIFNDGFYRYNKMAGVKEYYEPISSVIDIPVVYTGKWWCKIGKTIFAHPSSYSSGMLKTTEKSVNYFLRVDREFDCMVLAHTHKLGYYVQGGVHMFEQGAACHVEKMEYFDGKLVNPQQKGALYLCQDNDGNIIYDKCRLLTLE